MCVWEGGGGGPKFYSMFKVQITHAVPDKYTHERPGVQGAGREEDGRKGGGRKETKMEEEREKGGGEEKRREKRGREKGDPPCTPPQHPPLPPTKCHMQGF